MTESIYFDNAATSSPTLPEVRDAMVDCLDKFNANPGRSGHRLAVQAAGIIYDTREALGELFNVPDTENIILTKNSTEALNMVITGILAEGGHAVMTSFEHNSVARPLQRLQKTGRNEYSIIETPDLAAITTDDIESSLREDTRLIAVNGTSNVSGHHAPLELIVKIAQDRDIPLLVDASQTAGTRAIDLQALPIDFLAFTGHKHLFGPQGTGGLILRDTGRLPAFMTGGTGSRSAEIDHPDFAPDKFEAGTLNTPGFAGLCAGIRHLLDTGLETIISQNQALTAYALEQLGDIDSLEMHTRPGGSPTISFNLQGHSPDEVSHFLDREHGILCRPGLHCAPLAHRSMGTFPQGSVRLGFSHFNTCEEIDTAVTALTELAQHHG